MGNWITHAESQYPWERDALDFVRQRFPTHEPYRAWSNFEFIADDGGINEVDLLLFTPQGFFLIEIKSRPGRLTGDAGTWTWETDGRLVSIDNPLKLANLKAKKLRSLLQRQRAGQKKEVPWIEALVFCSAPDLRCELTGNAGFRVALRDREAQGDSPARSGIMAAVTRRECPGLGAAPRDVHDSPAARAIGQTMEQAGIRPSQRHRKVSDFVLEQLIGEGPGYQDWRATHSRVPESKRRVRLYLVRAGATTEERKTIERAALREFKLLETLQHPGILRTHGFTEHEVGPALIFDHDPLAIRLDHFLAQRKQQLDIDTQLDLLRQIADVVRYAHDKKVVHRALCPQSILVVDPNTDRQRIKIFNWQVGYRQAGSPESSGVTATSHVDWLVEDAGTAYMAPEALTVENLGENLDVFSLGAIAYHIFSGVTPAMNGLELSEKLRQTTGLQISAALNGACEALQILVQEATHPEVSLRTASVADFLGVLDEVEDELTTTEENYVEDPSRAQIGDLLPGGFHVERRLGQGASSVALLVARDGEEFVLKVAGSLEHNARLRDEAEVLGKLRHAHVVEIVGSCVLGDRAAFLMRPVFSKTEKDRKVIETLGQRLDREKRLHIDLLQRFGDDLLGVVNYLEEQGIPHRDIKPDNIAVGMVGRGDKLHLVLFDFSLSRAAAENLHAGTIGYLDPLLPLRDPARWDLHAERYAAGATLYELATGVMPQWGDGETDPSHLQPGTEITLVPELFDASLREGLSDFFARAFRRDPAQRFDNADDMLRAWRACFEAIGEPGALSDHTNEAELRELLAEATMDTPIHELALGTRASNALDRANIITVEDLLSVSRRRLARLPGVINQTRREMLLAVAILGERLGKPDREPVDDEPEPRMLDAGTLGIDLIARRISKAYARDNKTVRGTLTALLGLDDRLADPWPSQADVARVMGVTRVRVGQILGNLQVSLDRIPPLARLRKDLADIVAAHGGAMSLAEAAAALLVARGSAEIEPDRTRQARALVRAALEVERACDEPALIVRRDGDSILIARDAALAAYARRLGEVADQLAADDPLVAPGRAIERLREIPMPRGEWPSLSDARLVRLAGAASRQAELSNKLELYPRGMAAARALKLAADAIAGVKELTVGELRDRVASRYPSAAPLPDPPELDKLLQAAGLDMEWQAHGKRGAGCFVTRNRDVVSVSSGGTCMLLSSDAALASPPGEITPEEADKRRFAERLERAVREGAFLSLLVNPRYYDEAAKKLCRHFPLQRFDLEGLFLDALREAADKAKVHWDLVLATDARPGDGDWNKLLMLVARAMPTIEDRLLAADRTTLVVYAGILARYDQMELLGRLSQKVGRRGGIPGLWLLLPGDHPMIDGRPVPLMGPGQRARIPESWLNLQKS